MDLYNNASKKREEEEKKNISGGGCQTTVEAQTIVETLAAI